MAILGELDRAGLLNADEPTVHSATLREALQRWDICQTRSESVQRFYRAAPGGVPTQVAFSQDRRWENSILTARPASFVTRTTLSPRMAAWLFSRAIWLRMAAL